jgi:outer membrane protein TolC
MATQPVTQLLKIHSGVSAAHADARISHHDFERAQNEVVLHVKEVYYQLLSAQQHKRAAELRIEAAKEQLNESQVATDKGVALQVKVLESEAQIAGARDALGKLEDSIADLENSFDDLVGLPLGTDTEFVEPVDLTLPKEGDGSASSDVLSVAMSQNPELLVAQETVKKAHAGFRGC